MPLYVYDCRNGHETELRAGYDEVKIDCPGCPETAWRRAVYHDQFTITETGHVASVSDRRRRDHAGEKLNRLYKSSVETKRETGGIDSGPFKISERKTYGPRPNV